ncbi:MAG: NAD(+)/NADH kinase [Desulfovibrio sp.]
MLVVTKAKDDFARQLGANVKKYLVRNGVDVEVVEHHPDFNHSTMSPSGQPYDMIFILGGDGTFISVARHMWKHEIPVLGLNLGRVGFLTEIPLDFWEIQLGQVLAGGYEMSERLMLEFSVIRGEKEVHSGYAVNDVVISRGTLARLTLLRLFYGKEAISCLRSDGIIISTPTGSTAYGVSAGGPLIHPSMRAFCVTAICPFQDTFKSCVLPDTEPIEIHVESGQTDVHLTEDGQVLHSLEPGDVVQIRAAKESLHFVELDPLSYFKKLQMKGFLSEC